MSGRSHLLPGTRPSCPASPASGLSCCLPDPGCPSAWPEVGNTQAHTLSVDKPRPAAAGHPSLQTFPTASLAPPPGHPALVSCQFLVSLLSIAVKLHCCFSLFQGLPLGLVACPGEVDRLGPTIARLLTAGPSKSYFGETRTGCSWGDRMDSVDQWLTVTAIHRPVHHHGRRGLSQAWILPSRTLAWVWSFMPWTLDM